MYLKERGTIHGYQCKRSSDYGIKDTITEQRELISTLRIALDTSNAQIAELTTQIKLLNEQLEYMKKKLFGTSSEKRQLDEQLNLFNESEHEANPKVVEPKETV